MGWSWGIPDIERQRHTLNSDDQAEGQDGGAGWAGESHKSQEEEVYLEGGTEQELLQVSEISATPERCCRIISLLVVDWYGWKAERPARRGGEVLSARV